MARSVTVGHNGKYKFVQTKYSIHESSRLPYIGKIDDHVYGDWVMHDVYQHNALLLIYALITTTIRRAFDGHSTAYQTSLSHTDVYTCITR